MNPFLIFLFIVLISTSSHASSIPIKILKIYDGDTIKVKIDNGNKFSIRLQGIDCFETTKIHRAYKQAYVNKIDIEEVIERGNSATQYLKNLNKNKTEAYFDFGGIDKYARALGIVYFDEVNVNEELLKEGLCLKYEFKEE